MKRFLPALTVFALLGAATEAPAACRWFGTQVECDLGESQVLVGTQAAAEPSYAGRLEPQGLQGGAGLVDDRPAPAWPFRLQLQNIGADPPLCRRLGNETHCY